jgi:hypothetical protein
LKLKLFNAKLIYIKNIIKIKINNKLQKGYNYYMEKPAASLIQKKYIKKYQINNTMISMYVPKSVKLKIDQYCKKKGLEISSWIRSLIIKELENDAQTR